MFFLVFIFSCTSDATKSSNTNEEKKVTVVPLKENFATGIIIEKVICKKDSSQNYALYLPKNYDSKKMYPIVYIFDAHGTGKLPIEKYKELAEKYNYILIGSNNSKNGNSWEQSSNIAQTLFEDSQNRLSINPKRIYLLGFSGGARVANGLTILNGSIAGVICCSAAAPAINSESPRNNYSWFGIAGTQDFNYTEMKKYDLVELAGHGVKRYLITFDGKHEWCPESIMNEAFWWLELGAMRSNQLQKNDSLIKKNTTENLKLTKQFLEAKQDYEAYKLCKKTITFYDGLIDLSPFIEIYKSLQTNVEVDKELKLEEKLWSKEEALKQQYMQALQKNDYAWWQKEIASINQKIKTEKNKNESQLLQRVLSYLSLACYMQTDGLLHKENNIPAATYFCKLYILIDPTNSEAYYFMAEINAKQNENENAIKALEMAVKNGFSDVTRLQNDNSFSTLKGRKEFEKITEEIKK